MIKETFIKFLKEKHALKEWEQEVKHGHNIPASPDTLLSDIQKQPRNSEFMLKDGWFINYEDAITPIYWNELHEQWMEICRQNGWIKKVETLEEALKK